ncbi:uncharacterized protein LOC123499297 [Portunus trituberculatus]|uniref:uncharacterized protein LOC123499297 n=1 Tax=Portunus trituberculatus TaxID=210409 RepID=UPI001E1D0DC9|nr:uncharacterized protein LOC123499297 [Portunus trituberculatus]
MAVVSALATKVDNLTATGSGLSTEFAAFKNQQHTPAVLNRAKERVPCVSIACATHPRKRTRPQGNVQLLLHPHRGWIPPSSQSREPHDSPGASQGWPCSPASESKSPVADCEEDAAGEWTLVSRKKKRCYSPIPARTANPEPDQGHLKTASPKPDQGHLKTASSEPDQGHLKTASPEPDQGHLMAAMQMLMEQMSRLTQEVDGLKTQMQYHRDERR